MKIPTLDGGEVDFVPGRKICTTEVQLEQFFRYGLVLYQRVPPLQKEQFVPGTIHTKYLNPRNGREERAHFWTSPYTIATLHAGAHGKSDHSYLLGDSKSRRSRSQKKSTPA